MMSVAVNGTREFNNFYRTLKPDDLRKEQIDGAMEINMSSDGSLQRKKRDESSDKFTEPKNKMLFTTADISLSNLLKT
jgi:hypothetical protein